MFFESDFQYKNISEFSNEKMMIFEDTIKKSVLMIDLV